MSIQSLINSPLTKTVYEDPTALSILNKFQKEFYRQNPQALIFNSRYMSVMDAYLVALPFAKELPRLQLKNITRVEVPRFPEEKDFLYDDSKELDHTAYWFALDKYKSDLIIFCERAKKDHYQRGLLVTNHHFPTVFYSQQLAS